MTTYSVPDNPTDPEAATLSLANLPVPARVTMLYEWDDLKAGPEHASRYFKGSSWAVECGDDLDKDITVGLDGLQYADGRIKRIITTALGDHEAFDPLTSEQARQVAAALTAAADEADQMNGYDRIEVTR